VNISSGQDINNRPTLFFTIFVQHRTAAAAGKICLQIIVNFALLFTKNRVSLHNYRKEMCGAPAPKALHLGLQGRCTLLNPSPLKCPLPVSRNLDPPLVIVIMHFQMKSSKKVYWCHFAHCHSRCQRRL